MRQNIQNWVEAKFFQNLIIGLILINAVVLGLETSPEIMKVHGKLLHSIDSVILFVFTAEILLKFYAYRLTFFRQPWNLFDLSVVAIAYVPSAGPFAALRTLRILRVLRLISTIPSLRKVIEGLVKSVPGILSVAVVMLIFFYIFAVIGTFLFGTMFPEWFGSLGKTMFTLFQVMTLESWSMGIVRPVMDVYPNAWIFFILYILTTTFTMLNLFIAIIVNSMHTASADSAEESRLIIRDELSQQIKGIEKSILEKLNKN